VAAEEGDVRRERLVVDDGAAGGKRRQGSRDRPSQHAPDCIAPRIRVVPALPAVVTVHQ
jgi:hypothetical protein